MRSYSEYTWNECRLYYQGEYEGYTLIPHDKYNGMWYTLTPDGIGDFYNITRAKDNLIKMNLTYCNRIAERASTDPTGAFK